MITEGLYTEIRLAIRETRKTKGLTQTALGKRVGMMQRHISDIECGKIIPRLDTLLEILRSLQLDLMLVPIAMRPIITALISGSSLDRPLYALDDENNDEESP